MTHRCCAISVALAVSVAGCGGGTAGSTTSGNNGSGGGGGTVVAGRDWTLATPNGAAFGKRFWPGGNAAVVFNGAMWTFGNGSSNNNSDVWTSTDGVRWTQTTPSAGFSNSWYSTAGGGDSVYPFALGFTAFNGKLWAINGPNTWSSSDGVSWTQGVGPLGLSMQWVYALAFNAELWVILPVSNGDRVYHSPDGVSWSLATAAAPWGTARIGASVAVFNGRMWVIGGSTAGGMQNDVWSSSDGVHWTAATLGAGFSPRYGHSTVVYGDQLWVIGGARTDATVYDDVWASSDGVSWTEMTAGAAWASRYDASAVAFNGAMWLLGGMGQKVGTTYPTYPLYDGVWRSP